MVIHFQYGIQALVSSLLLFIWTILIAMNMSYWARFTIPWFAASAVLALVHGMLNLLIPDFISKVPLVFDRSLPNATENVRTDSAPAEDGGSSYSRMFTNLFRTNENDEELISRPTPGHRLSLRELAKESTMLYRNTFHIVSDKVRSSYRSNFCLFGSCYVFHSVT